jgi:hypothetical protein
MQPNTIVVQTHTYQFKGRVARFSTLTGMSTQHIHSQRVQLVPHERVNVTSPISREDSES